MMPVIRPLTIPDQPCTEYKKEQESFARMQVELRPSRVDIILRRVRVCLRKLAGTRPERRRCTAQSKLGSREPVEKPSQVEVSAATVDLDISRAKWGRSLGRGRRLFVMVRVVMGSGQP